MGDNVAHVITQNLENAELRERAVRLQLRLLEEAVENIREITAGLKKQNAIDPTKVDALVSRLENLGRELSANASRVVTLTKMLARSANN